MRTPVLIDFQTTGAASACTTRCPARRPSWAARRHGPGQGDRAAEYAEWTCEFGVMQMWSWNCTRASVDFPKVVAATVPKFKVTDSRTSRICKE